MARATTPYRIPGRRRPAPPEPPDGHPGAPRHGCDRGAGRDCLMRPVVTHSAAARLRVAHLTRAHILKNLLRGPTREAREASSWIQTGLIAWPRPSPRTGPAVA